MIPLSKALATWVRREPGSQRARQAVALTVPDQLHCPGREFPQQPREADDIRICGGISADGGHTRAFINKLDAKVGTLSNCERLSLSTNCIDKLLPFSGMTKLKILSLGRNLLKRVEKLDDLAGTLEQLWLSYNSISGLDGVLPLTNLQVLYMAHNAIKDWAEIEKLAGLAHLREVIFIGNPIYEGMDDIVKVDTKLVTDELREAAAALP
ncbi:DNAL1 [Symbiodinium sp. KB8]|nr:DNAL1 [Symbiodinium sp. KB8]